MVRESVAEIGAEELGYAEYLNPTTGDGPAGEHSARNCY
jgi:hypothetical protein